VSEKVIVQSIKKHVNGQGNNWKFVMGKDVLTKAEFAQKLDKDPKFRAFVVELVVNLSVDMLGKGG